MCCNFQRLEWIKQTQFHTLVIRPPMTKVRDQCIEVWSIVRHAFYIQQIIFFFWNPSLTHSLINQINSKTCRPRSKGGCFISLPFIGKIVIFAKKKIVKSLPSFKETWLAPLLLKMFWFCPWSEEKLKNLELRFLMNPRPHQIEVSLLKPYVHYMYTENKPSNKTVYDWSRTMGVKDGFYMY